MKVHLIILILGVLNSCSKSTEKDTAILPKKDYSYENPTCSSEYKGNFKSLGFEVSNYYELYQKVKIFDTDSVAIISPKLLSPTGQDCRDNEKKLLNNRLLITNIKGKKNIYDNVISNRIGMGASGAELIRPYKNGFILYKSLGGGCKFDYEIHVKAVNNSLFIENIEYKYKCPNKSDTILRKVINYSKNKKKLSDFNTTIIDSIMANP